MHQIRFRLGLRPDPAGRPHSAPPDLLAGFQELLLREREGKGFRREKGRRGMGREWNGKTGKAGE